MSHFCPSCDRELASIWCTDCEAFVFDHRFTSLEEWKALNPGVVEEVRAGLFGLPTADELGDPMLKRRAA